MTTLNEKPQKRSRFSRFSLRALPGTVVVALVIASTLALFGLITLLPTLGESISTSSPFFLALIAALVPITGTFLLQYLGSDVSRRSERSFRNYLLHLSHPQSGTRRSILELQELIRLFNDEHLSSEIPRGEFPDKAYREAVSKLALTEKHEAPEEFEARLRAKVGEDVLKFVEDKYAAEMQKKAHLEELRARAEVTKLRLVTEIDALSRRSNVNLVIGILTTAFAAALLGYITLHADLASPDWRSILPGYLLRLSFVIFVEVFAFFFLRMYRTNLNEIKYYQNELTNSESRFMALEAAIMLDDADAIRSTIVVIGQTERNFVLQKGETTVDLERLRIEAKGTANLVNKLNAATSAALGKLT